MSVKRIQRKRTLGWKMPENTVYVGRGTKWGNPFAVGKSIPKHWESVFDDADKFHYFKWMGDVETNEEAVYLFKKYCIPSVDELEIKELRGKNLACWCKEKERFCHADELLKIANTELTVK